MSEEAKDSYEAIALSYKADRKIELREKNGSVKIRELESNIDGETEIMMLTEFSMNPISTNRCMDS